MVDDDDPFDHEIDPERLEDLIERLRNPDPWCAGETPQAVRGLYAYQLDSTWTGWIASLPDTDWRLCQVARFYRAVVTYDEVNRFRDAEADAVADPEDRDEAFDRIGFAAMRIADELDGMMAEIAAEEDRSDGSD